MQLNILVIDEELPFPLNSGKRVRSFNLLSRLARKHRITYLAHRNADPDEAHAAAKALKQIGIEPITADFAVPPKSGLEFYTRLALNLFSPLPYSVTSHTSRTLQQRLHDELTNRRYDLVHCEWTPYAETLRHRFDIPVVISAHNVESQIWQRYHENESPGLKRWYIGHQWKKFKRFERWAFARACQTIVVSDQDAELARRSFNAKRVTVVENGVDLDRFSATYDNRKPYELLIMGSLDWRPNIDGTEQFLKKVYLRLRDAEPNLRLVVIGRNPHRDWAEWVRSIPGVELHSNVPDVRPYLAKAACLVVPLRSGGGTRLKILEAAAMGLPVVSTAVGAEGLEFEPNEHYLASESIESIGPVVLQCLRDPVAARKRAQSARAIVEQKYSWDVLAMRQDTCWRACIGAGDLLHVDK